MYSLTEGGNEKLKGAIDDPLCQQEMHERSWENLSAQAQSLNRGGRSLEPIDQRQETILSTPY